MFGIHFHFDLQKKVIIGIILVVVLVVIIAILAWYFGSYQKATTSAPKTR
jgi:flagellar basal body-associated protein FliL